MGAGVVDGVESAGHVEKGDAASLGLHDLAGPWRYLLRLCDLHQLGHGISSFQGDEVPDHFMVQVSFMGVLGALPAPLSSARTSGFRDRGRFAGKTPSVSSG